MIDATILVIKPELIRTRGFKTTETDGPIAEDLSKRGFKIIQRRYRDDWIDFAKEFYASKIGESYIEAYLKIHRKMCWGGTYAFFTVSHPEGDSVIKLREARGTLKGYQEGKETDTLRAKFGLPESFNKTFKDMTFVYSGIHCPENNAELLKNINFFGIERLFEIE